MSWLRRIIGRSRREKVRNEQTREELGAEETVVPEIKKRRLQWFGHVERMEEKRQPNAALHGHVEGKRSRGRQRKTWMDNVREDLKGKNIDLTRIGEATRNTLGLEESCKSLIASMLMEERKEDVFNSAQNIFIYYSI